jgi:hypothetical protein
MLSEAGLGGLGTPSEAAVCGIPTVRFTLTISHSSRPSIDIISRLLNGTKRKLHQAITSIVGALQQQDHPSKTKRQDTQRSLCQHSVFGQSTLDSTDKKDSNYDATGSAGGEVSSSWLYLHGHSQGLKLIVYSRLRHDADGGEKIYEMAPQA